MSGGSGGSRARLRRGPPVPALDPEQRVRGDAPDTLLLFLATSVPPPRVLGFRPRRRIAAGEDLDLLVRSKPLGPLMLDTCYGFSTPPLRLIAPCYPLDTRPIELETLFVEERSIAEKESGEWPRELSTGNSVLKMLNPFSSETPQEFAGGNFEDHQGGFEVSRTSREIRDTEEQESLEPSVILSPNEMMRQRIEDAKDLVCRRRKVPHTYLDAWKVAKIGFLQDTFMDRLIPYSTLVHLCYSTTADAPEIPCTESVKAKKRLSYEPAESNNSCNEPLMADIDNIDEDIPMDEWNARDEDFPLSTRTRAVARCIHQLFLDQKWQQQESRSVKPSKAARGKTQQDSSMKH